MSEDQASTVENDCPCGRGPGHVRIKAAGCTPNVENDAAPSYHDLHITTASLPRTSIFNLPYGYEVTCNRVGGWCLWLSGKQVAGEYGDGLRLDVGGHVICDSLTRPIPPAEKGQNDA